MQNRRLFSGKRRVAIAPALFFSAVSVPAQTVHGGNRIELPPPPVAAVKTVVDDYHGMKV